MPVSTIESIRLTEIKINKSQKCLIIACMIMTLHHSQSWSQQQPNSERVDSQWRPLSPKCTNNKFNILFVYIYHINLFMIHSVWMCNNSEPLLFAHWQANTSTKRIKHFHIQHQCLVYVSKQSCNFIEKEKNWKWGRNSGKEIIRRYLIVLHYLV